MDTHALSEPAHQSCLEVLAGSGVQTRYQVGLGYTPTPVISHAILTYNRGRRSGLADGLVITPSHNPPSDGGIKYNPPDGGPADTETTKAIEARANALLAEGLAGVSRMPYGAALRAATSEPYDFVQPYVEDLAQVLDLQVVARAGLRLGVDPLGGAGLAYPDPIAERYGLSIEVVNRAVDPTFAFMTVDGDGKIRMDCSSPHAMAGLIRHKDRFDVAFRQRSRRGSPRHRHARGGAHEPQSLPGRGHRLPLHAPPGLAARRGRGQDPRVERPHRPSGRIPRPSLAEVPVGFKWFVPGLRDGSYGFGGEESAGASFLRRDGTAWTTDKDGILLALLAAEITATLGEDPGARYLALTERLGTPCYERLDAPATPEEKAVLGRLSPKAVQATTLAGDPDHGPPDPCSGERRRHWRAEGHHEERLVRRQTLRHRGHLQDLRRELPGPRAPAGAPGRSQGYRQRGSSLGQIDRRRIERRGSRRLRPASRLGGRTSRRCRRCGGRGQSRWRRADSQR